MTQKGLIHCKAKQRTNQPNQTNQMIEKLRMEQPFQEQMMGGFNFNPVSILPFNTFFSFSSRNSTTIIGSMSGSLKTSKWTMSIIHLGGSHFDGIFKYFLIVPQVLLVISASLFQVLTPGFFKKISQAHWFKWLFSCVYLNNKMSIKMIFISYLRKL